MYTYDTKNASFFLPWEMPQSQSIPLMILNDVSAKKKKNYTLSRKKRFKKLILGGFGST